MPLLEGKSLLPIFKGKTRPGHEALFWEMRGDAAVRKGKWKLFPLSKELYDLELDRTEMNNVYKDRPEIVRELEPLYMRWARDCGATPFARRPKRKAVPAGG